MIQKFVEEMTDVELEKLLKNDESLRNYIEDACLENVGEYISQILDEFGNSISDYSIDLYSYSYIKFRNSVQFLYKFLDVHTDSFIHLGEKEKKELEKACELGDKFHSMEYDEENPEAYDELENELDKIADNFSDILTKKLVNIYESVDFDYMLNSFRDYYIESYEEFYIKNNDFSKLYHIEEVTV